MKWNNFVTVLSCALLFTSICDAAAGKKASAAHAAPAKKVSPYAKGAMPEGAKRFYADTFGVSGMSAKLAESGELVRFSYTVEDGSKAALLGDKASTPYLIDERAHVALQIPHMEKVGQLRQTGAQENGKSYWMVFSNKGGLVRVGHRVSVVVGGFRADGLIVQ